MPLCFCRTQKLPLRRIEHRTLRHRIGQRSDKSFDAERVADLRPSKSGTDKNLQDVSGAVQFAIRGQSTLHIGIGNCRSSAVREREPDGALEGQRFGIANG